jgi:KUP system potassium uptake protein
VTGREQDLAVPPAPRPFGPNCRRLGRRGATTPGLGCGITLAALGVVYGDIGTSPLYAVPAVFSIDGGAVRTTPMDVYGVISMIFWSVTLVVSILYVTFILRADNDGEGGVIALAALLRHALGKTGGRWTAVAVAFGALGASLFYGDSVITPAISVLSAVEGLQVTQPRLAHLAMPLAVAILTGLFAVQRWGANRVGRLFGPVMLLWFVALAVAGLHEVVGHPGIVRGLSPTYALAFAVNRPTAAFIAIGGVVLAITGAEALYADVGHFGRGPIRSAWFVVVFPALTLNYLAQGALILRDPATKTNPFFLLLPAWAQLPMVLLATAATVIASQAVISGAFSVSRQAVRLGLLPHLRIRHTSSDEPGQVYLPAVNWSLYAAVSALVLEFHSSTRLAGAYGVAVTGTFLITTALFVVVARALWAWAIWELALFAAAFGVTELTYFAANLTKVMRGGWVPLLTAIVIFTVMTTWQQGADIVTARRTEMEGPLRDFVRQLSGSGIHRVAGTAVFPHSTPDTTPLALRANVEHNHVRHEHIVIISAQTANVPHVQWNTRIQVDHLDDPHDGIVRVVATFGFQDRTDIPQVLRRVVAEGIERDISLDRVSYFLSRIVLQRTREPCMSIWRKRLFVLLANYANSPGDYLTLPHDRTIVIGAELDI